MLASILVSTALVVGLQTQSTAPTTKPAQGAPTTRQAAPAAKPAAASTSATVQARAKSIPATAVAAGNFNTLVTALQAADLVTALEGTGPFTVFAPTDEAFAKLPPGTVEMLLKPENKAKLIDVLTYHVVPGKVVAADVTKLRFAETLEGQRIDIVTKDGKVLVDGAEVVKTDIACSNGVIHVIDRVILPVDLVIPQVAANAGTFNTLLAAAKAAGLVEVLSSEGPFTVFAPTDEAFAKLPKGTVESLLQPENKAKLVEILTYHVVPGRIYSDEVVAVTEAPTVLGRNLPIAAANGVVTVGGAKVVAVDIEASNGVIHVVDAVILPGAASGSAADAPKSTKPGNAAN